MRFWADSIHAIGWFPYHAKRAPVAYEGVDVLVGRQVHPRAARRLARAFVELFYSGNPEPPTYLRRHRLFMDYLRHREYRFAVFFNEVRVFPGPDGLYDCEYEYAGKDVFLGYTPFRMLGLYLRGRAADDGLPLKSRGPNGVVLTQRVQVMLGGLPNAGGHHLIGHWAPYAWVEVRYEIPAVGPAVCKVYGSSLPNQKFYRNLERVYDYRLDALNADEISAFLRAGDRVPAPGWPGDEIELKPPAAGGR